MFEPPLRSSLHPAACIAACQTTTHTCAPHPHAHADARHSSRFTSRYTASFRWCTLALHAGHSTGAQADPRDGRGSFLMLTYAQICIDTGFYWDFKATGQSGKLLLDFKKVAPKWQNDPYVHALNHVAATTTATGHVSFFDRFRRPSSYLPFPFVFIHLPPPTHT